MDATPAAPDLAAPIAPIEIDVVVPCEPTRAFDYFPRARAAAWSRRRATAPSTLGAR